MKEKNQLKARLLRKFLRRPIEAFSVYKFVISLLLFTGINQLSAQSADKMVPFNFSLQKESVTSAGVFRRDGTLVKTLWNNKKLGAGNHTAQWDRTNDDGQLLTDTGYIVKVVSNNVTYNWDGVIGNTSDSVNGNTRIKAFERVHAMASYGNYMYYAIGYCEGKPSCYKFDLSNPYQKMNILAVDWSSVDAESHFIATDGNNVYWTGFDPYNMSVSLVYATKVSDDKEVTFSSGQKVKMTFGREYKGAIDVNTTNVNAHPSGLAVMKNGNFLFVSHEGLNELHVLDKTTGSLVQTISVNKPRELCMDNNDELWMISGTNTLEKYSINSNGTLSSAILSITGLKEPLALAISPNNSTLLVADGGTSQQVKAFWNVSGTLVKTMGSEGGYENDPKVNDYKFYFNDGVTQLTKTYLAYQSDSTFWVGDVGNERSQHYTSSGTYINRIMCLPHSYSTVVDKNDPTRVFNEYLEFKIDYSKPLSPHNGSWTLVKNWRHSIPVNYFQENMFRIFRQMVTLSNGKTYSYLEKLEKGNRIPELVELPDSGNLRFTGIMLAPFAVDNLEEDGTLRKLVTSNNLNDSGYWETKKITGFSNGNPVWGTAQKVAFLPKIKSNDPSLGGISYPAYTSSGLNLVFNPNKENKGYHLGAVKNGSRTWLWRVCPSTLSTYTGMMPRNGDFDNGNNVEYAGGHVYAVDKNIFWNYHGEFWKNSQTNIWNHFYDNGLMIGQFGIVSLEGSALHKECFAMGAGNVFSSTVVKVGQDYYIYHNDESVQGGIHRWKISNLNSISEQTLEINEGLFNLNGVKVTYFDGQQLNNTKTTAVVVKNQFTLSSNDKEITDISNYSARFEGFIKPIFSQSYKFYVNTNKGARLWINGQLILNRWDNASQNDLTSNNIDLIAGNMYEIRLEVSGELTALQWSSAGQAKQAIPSNSIFPPVSSNMNEGIDLMEGLRDWSILQNNMYGWTRNSNDEKNVSWNDYYNVNVNKKSSNRKMVDVLIRYRGNNSSCLVTRDIGMGDSCLQDWKLSGSVNYESNYPNWNTSGAGYFDIVDKDGRIIARITHDMTYISDANKPTQIKINGKPVVDKNEKYLYSTLNKHMDFEISVNSSGVTLKYANFSPVTAPLYDKTAKWNSPHQIKVSQTGYNYDKSIDLSNLRFFKTTSTKPVISTGSVAPYCSGDSVVLSSNINTNNTWSNGKTTSKITVKNSGVYTLTTVDNLGCSMSSEPVNIQFNSLPVPNIQTNKAYTFCQGDSITLSTGPYKNYKWNNNTTASSIKVKNGGTYSVTVTDNNGCIGSSSKVITMHQNPVASVTSSGNLSFCQGKTVTLSANAASSYLWSNGETQKDLVVGNSGSYSVTITDVNGCKAKSAATQVNVSLYPKPTITAIGAKEFCQGDSVKLEASESNVYLWSNGATTKSIVVKQTGEFTVNGGDGTGCSATSDMESVQVNERPVPTVTIEGNDLISSYDVGNQWYLNGKPIDGATNKTYTAKDSGSYFVKVTDVKLCDGISSTLEFAPKKVGIEEIVTRNIEMYPNPSKGLLTITSETGIIKVEIYNQFGQVCLTTIDNFEGMRLDAMASGMYLVRVYTGENESSNLKLIIE